MAPAPDRRDRGRRHSPGESTSPARDRMWNRSRSLPRREKERPREKEREKEKERERSPSKRSTSAHRTRDNSLRDRSSSPDHERPKAKTFSRSPSPRTKRLRRAQVELEGDRSVVRERERSDGREERDWNGRHREREDGLDGASERRLGREKDDGGSSRASRHERAASPQERAHNRSRRGSRSPARASKSGAREEAAKTREVEIRDDDSDSVAKMKAAEDALKVKDKQKPSFELSGKLAEETNRVRGVTLLFTEPSDARKPDIRWRLYVFKAGEVQNDPLYLHRQSCYLFGRERRVADIPTDHPSCSKQHAVIQYRLVETEQPDGLLTKQVRPYLMDLGSTNGTFINDNRIEPQRYYELFEKDTIRFGNSSREYVLLHENSTK